MLESELRINVLERFQALNEKIAALCQSILDDEPLIAWMKESAQFPVAGYSGSHRQKACAIIQQVEYMDMQAPREILVSAGFLGASERTLEHVKALNEEKSYFKQAVITLKENKISVKEPSFSQQMNDILKKRPQVLVQHLHPLGMARVHLKQCYRQIPILPHAPQKISWTWAHTRSIKKITVSKADQLLSQKGDSLHITLLRNKLQTLPPNEPLAIIQELAPHLRANIVMMVNNQIKRMMIKGPMPIFFPAGLETPCPAFKPPKEKHEKDKQRMIRSDVKLDPTPFLPLIRAHRYLEHE